MLPEQGKHPGLGKSGMTAQLAGAGMELKPLHTFPTEKLRLLNCTDVPLLTWLQYFMPLIPLKNQREIQIPAAEP